MAVAVHAFFSRLKSLCRKERAPARRRPPGRRRPMLGKARELYRSLVDTQGPLAGDQKQQDEDADAIDASEHDDQPPPLEVQRAVLMQHQPFAIPRGPSKMVIDEPDHLLCPISFTLLYDPVMLVSGT